MKYLSQVADILHKPLVLPGYEGFPSAVHLFSDQQIAAVDAALAAERPLLVRGEPGTGKSQLARAAAVALGRHFLARTLDAHAEATELFWRMDSVRRLAEAQLWAPILSAKGRDQDIKALQEKLAERRFVEPGLLWWAFDRLGAREQHDLFEAASPQYGEPVWVQDDSAGSVVLLDEIDKADPILPNALLEALGIGRFPVPGLGASVSMGDVRPLVVITTNEERSLPDAFVRRCLVLHLELPSNPEALKALLVERGRAHAKPLRAKGFALPGEKVLTAAAEVLVRERTYFKGQGRMPPGQAEYFDLIRVLVCQTDEEERRLSLLETVAPFILKKHEGFGRTS